jgi:hypothetical protein
MFTGSEAYHAALTFCNSVKHAASQDVPGAKAVYEALKTRYHASNAPKMANKLPNNSRLRRFYRSQNLIPCSAPLFVLGEKTSSLRTPTIYRLSHSMEF